MIKIPQKTKEKISNIFYIFVLWGFVLLVILGLFTFVTRQRIGAECDDGWTSRSVGSGTCSHHGGVENWGYKYWYNRDKIMPRSSINPATKEYCEYGYNAIIKECCIDDDDYSCEVYENAPDGATAFCNDNTYSLSSDKNVACLNNGGINDDPQFSPFIWN